MATKQREQERSLPLSPEDVEDTALEGAADEDAGVIRRADVEGGEDISIDAPPSPAGGIRNSPIPSHEDLRR